MSHFTDVKVELKNKQSIVLALKAMGFKSNMIETATSNTLGLKEYNGPFSGKKACIRIKGNGWGKEENYIGGLSTDIGFEQLSNGTMKYFVDNSSKYASKDWVKQLTNEYIKYDTYRVLQAQGYTLTEESNDNHNEIHVKAIKY